MAIRNIREMGDPVLNKVCKEVKEVTPRTLELIQDMVETMYEANGVGLAAPQVGILKRIVVIDDTEGHKFAMVNPVITEMSGEQISQEGCLSLPGFAGRVKRPQKVTVKALDRDGKEFTVEAEGFLAIIMCHEIDHLDGVLFKKHVVEMLEEEN